MIGTPVLGTGDGREAVRKDHREAVFPEHYGEVSS